MSARRLLVLALASAGLTACATAEPVCRPADAAERAVFGAIVAHDEARVADLMAASGAATANRLRGLDPALEAQVFGARMSDPAVRTVLMQPPLCLVDEPAANGARTSYVFPQARFAALQSADLPGLERGRAGIDHAACRFVQENGQWKLADACLTTFAPASPAS